MLQGIDANATGPGAPVTHEPPGSSPNIARFRAYPPRPLGTPFRYAIMKPMSSIDACLNGIARANERLLSQPLNKRREHIRERSISVIVPDLDTTFDMRLTIDGLTDVTPRPLGTTAPSSQVKVTVSANDLVALAEDRLDPAKALFSRRLKVDASLGDLLRLRRLL